MPHKNINQRKQYNKEWNAKNRDKFNQQYKKQAQTRMKKYKVILIEYLGGCCKICGYDKCPNALDFHHTKDKKEMISRMLANCNGLKKLKQEADKCILLCANCHRELHSQ